ncbi:MAG TPA: PQQ-binding-like beta-propeller repeat protein, partial [Terriglobia bacterium]|nr:PQQ-binding-like beta-propeller repeat protein [Terriglobia bacterium]
MAISVRAADPVASAMFRGDAAHTGVYAATLKGIHGLRWKFKTGAMVRSSAAVADATVYFGSDDGNLYAVELKSGKLKWKFATGGRVASSPAVVDGMVYFQSDDRTFYALEAATGKVAWRFRTGEDVPHVNPALPPWIDDWDYFLSSPVVVSG